MMVQHGASTPTRSECALKHRYIRYTFSVVFAIMTLMLTLVGYASSAVYTSGQLIESVNIKMEQHHSAGAVETRHLEETFREIKEELREHRKMLERLLQGDKAHVDKNHVGNGDLVGGDSNKSG